MARWREVPGWPYEVSDEGDVRRCGAAPGARVGRVLRPWLGGPVGSEYYYVTLSSDGDRADPRLHRLVALVWIGEPPFEGAEVDHIDGDRFNNTLANLRYVDRSTNVRASTRWPDEDDPTLPEWAR